jgi:hypothetical protein
MLETNEGATEVDQDVEGLRSELEQKLPLILADFKNVLIAHGITGARVMKFILVPDLDPDLEADQTSSNNVECNEDVCVVVH